MERYNPFSNSTLTDETDPFNRSAESAVASNQSSRRFHASGRTETAPVGGTRFMASSQAAPPSASATNIASASRYSTAFPDPFGEIEPPESLIGSRPAHESAALGANRSNSVTFAPSSSRSVDEPAGAAASPRSSRREAGGISSFLSRATSVTSSTVTDRVSEAVGSMRSAVDSISSQIQQAVPTNLNERLTSNLTSGAGDQSPQQQQQQQQSAASFLASKLSSATNQFTSSSPNPSSMPLISRQRVILILDTPGETDWALQFVNYRRLASGLGPASSSSNALTSFFSSATAQLTSSSASSQLDGADLIEQADFRDVSVLANQSTSTATVLVSTSTGGQSRSGAGAGRVSTKIIRPEYVVVRQRTKHGLEQMRGIVTALNYCLVPMFEPMEVWNTFQDRRLIFSRLLSIRKQLGKENFPLIPQVYCQTHQDFLNYIGSSSVVLPCLVRTGQSGTGKIKMDNIQMLRDFASIMATSNLSCTVEPYLDVKCDLVVQKLGAQLKLFRKSCVPAAAAGEPGSSLAGDGGLDARQVTPTDPSQQFPARQSASRQTSLGTGVLSSLISTATAASGQVQQISRQGSNPYSVTFDKLCEVNARYKRWVEAISSEFGGRLEVFCVKLVVTKQDREYIVGLGDCSMDFLGAHESQDEDRSSFVELIINNMNAILPQTGNSSKEPSSIQGQQQGATSTGIGRCLSDDRAGLASTSLGYQPAPGGHQDLALGDKKRFTTSQTQINGHVGVRGPAGHSGANPMGHRSQSVSMNQSDQYLVEREAISSKSSGSGTARRGSERSDSLTNESSMSGCSSLAGMPNDSSSSGLHQRQASLGQSFFDQTSTAFNTLQKQSISFFKRLDSRAGELGSNTPPQSAKSDRGFERSNNSNDDLAVSRKNGFKSQSIDSWDSVGGAGPKRETPPKPPPPQGFANRQSSLASYSTQSGRPNKSTTPASTRQNSTIGASASSDANQKVRVVRQNSALSAFEPYDPDLTLHPRSDSARDTSPSTPSLPVSRLQEQHQTGDGACSSGRANKQLDPVKKSTNFDSASITSGDSNSTSEATTTEDTMNNLKKTFASIFGDKCE